MLLERFLIRMMAVNSNCHVDTYLCNNCLEKRLYQLWAENKHMQSAGQGVNA